MLRTALFLCFFSVISLCLPSTAIWGQMPEDVAGDTVVEATAMEEAAEEQDLSGLHENLIKTKDGLERLYYVYVPESATGENGATYPAVLMLHGGGGNALQIRDHVQIEELAEREGFLVFYPEGTAKKVLRKKLATWNGGFCCGAAAEENIDDAGFIAEMLEEAAQNYPLDPARIYATGISNGGLMANVLACKLADRIAAISSVGGPGMPPECKPSRPVPVMIIHGTADKCALYEGGEACGGCWEEVIAGATKLTPKKKHFPCMGVAQQDMFWREVNGCSAEAAVTFKNGDTLCRRSSDCTGGSAVAVCTIYEGGHTWPGSPEKDCLPVQKFCQAHRAIVGKTSRDFDANEMMWRFFKSYSLGNSAAPE
jgi:polyhydroxybutyrate depolymerase